MRNNKYRGAIKETYGGCRRASLLFVYTWQSRGFVRSDGKLVVSTGLVLRGIAETCLGPEVMKIQPPRRRSCAHRIRYVLAAFIEFILVRFNSPLLYPAALSQSSLAPFPHLFLLLVACALHKQRFDTFILKRTRFQKSRSLSLQSISLVATSP